MSSSILWYTTFLGLMFGYLIVQFSTKNKKYFYYLLLGMIFGFYFDIVSFTNGYYSYPDFYLFKVLGIPFTMTIGEGFSVAITIYIFDRIKRWTDFI